MQAAAYRPHLTASQLIAELSALLAEGRRIERLVCRYLADLADVVEQGQGDVLRGHGDVYHLARCKLGLGVRATRERIRIGRALRELPAVEEAFVAGELSYSRTREVTRVACPEDEARWLAQARELPMRTLERRVAEASGGKGDDRAREREPAEARYLTPDVMELRLALPAEVWALLERAMQGARRGSEDSLSDAEALAAVARDALAQQAAGHADPRRTVVLYECRHCERTEVDTGAAPVELSVGAAAALGCGAKVADLRTLGRVVKRGGTLPAAVRGAVLLRDRCRCRVPGCNRRRYVDVHHLEEQCVGGVHSRCNCVTLCSDHHRQLHEGQLRIEGNADAELRFFDGVGEAIVDALAMTQGGSRSSSAAHDAADPVETKLLAAMGRRGGWHPDVLCDATGLSIAQVQGALTRLELSGRIAQQWGHFSPSP